MLKRRKIAAHIQALKIHYLSVYSPKQDVKILQQKFEGLIYEKVRVAHSPKTKQSSEAIIRT